MYSEKNTLKVLIFCLSFINTIVHLFTLRFYLLYSLKQTVFVFLLKEVNNNNNKKLLTSNVTRCSNTKHEIHFNYFEFGLEIYFDVVNSVCVFRNLVKFFRKKNLFNMFVAVNGVWSRWEIHVTLETLVNDVIVAYIYCFYIKGVLKYIFILR